MRAGAPVASPPIIVNNEATDPIVDTSLKGSWNANFKSVFVAGHKGCESIPISNSWVFRAVSSTRANAESFVKVRVNVKAMPNVAMATTRIGDMLHNDTMGVRRTDTDLPAAAVKPDVTGKYIKRALKPMKTRAMAEPAANTAPVAVRLLDNMNPDTTRDAMTAKVVYGEAVTADARAKMKLVLAISPR